MKILILGMGHVGSALAQVLEEGGHTVYGTTTTPAKVEQLNKYCSHVYVLRGDEEDKVRVAAEACDMIVVCVAPNVKAAKTVAERQASYEQALVASCRSAINACQHVIFLSSFSVYGDGGQGSEPIDERTPTSNNDEPSSCFYQMAEQKVLSSEKGCVLRLPDIYGAPSDLSFTERAKLGHSLMGGKVPFGPDAPLYCIHYLDVVSATVHAIENHLAGIFNVCENNHLPKTNQEIFDELCEREDLPKLTFLDQIKAPNRRISADKLMSSGFSLKYTDVNYPLK